jgi:hypothetical protein
MKAATETSARSRATLDQRIVDLELRLKRDRSAARLRFDSLLRSACERLASPAALLLAAGAGFAVHRFSLLQRPLPSSAAEAAPAAPDSLLNGMVRGLGLAVSLFALLPEPGRARPGAADPDARIGRTD